MTQKVLVIDDDPDVRELLQVRLGALGFEMIAAAGGKEGGEKIRSDKPDLVFLDVTLPEENGFEFLRRLKIEMPAEIEKIPIVMLTAHDHLREDSVKAGASGYLTKPFDLPALQAVLTQFLGS